MLLVCECVGRKCTTVQVGVVPNSTCLTCSKLILPLQVLCTNQLHIDQGIGLGTRSTAEPPAGGSLGQLSA